MDIGFKTELVKYELHVPVSLTFDFQLIGYHSGEVCAKSPVWFVSPEFGIVRSVAHYIRWLLDGGHNVSFIAVIGARCGERRQLGDDGGEPSVVVPSRYLFV